MTRLVLATRNRDKLAEMKALLGDAYEVVSAAELDAPEVIEDHPTLEGNAEKKARELCAFSGLPALADDTGLEVAALDGAPGVYSARYSGEDATYQDNCDKLVREMAGQADRSACFRTVVAFATPDGDGWTVEGRLDGEILEVPRGSGGFGYDPLFYVPEAAASLAELEPVAKNAISHRGRAMRAAVAKLAEGLAEGTGSG